MSSFSLGAAADFDGADAELDDDAGAVALLHPGKQITHNTAINGINTFLFFIYSPCNLVPKNLVYFNTAGLAVRCMNNSHARSV
jgi:hypothetical protein